VVNQDLAIQLQRALQAQKEGNFSLAEERYNAALKDDPNNVITLNLLGVLCIKQQQPALAVEYINRAIAINAMDPQSYNNLGLAHKDLHHFGQAQQAFELCLQINAQQPTVLSSLGNVLASQNQHKKAVQCYESALALQPNYAECLNNLSLSLVEENRLEHALLVIDRAITMSPSNAVYQGQKGKILLTMCRYVDSERHLRQALALDSRLLGAMINLSTVLKQTAREQDAVQWLRKVLLMEPAHGEACNCLGVLYEQMGELDKAAKYFRLAMTYAPKLTSAYYQLAKLKNELLSGRERDAIEQLLADESFNLQLKGPLFFAMACDEEKRGDYNSSMQYLLEGNEVRSKNHLYDRELDDLYYHDVSEIFPVDNCAIEYQPLPIVPVFILGMPRSGTTLLEQILSSHSQIAGAGELSFISDLVAKAMVYSDLHYPQCCHSLTSDAISRLRQEYVSRLQERSQGQKFVIDKTPMNFNYIGFIRLVFPEAKIFYCQRNPVDNCLSIFKLPFDENQHYSHDLQSLGIYYQLHTRLMTFWKKHYSPCMHTVTYEKTVKDTEDQVRQCLDFLNLSFESEVLNFYQSKRLVLTPSAQQVRQPIYQSSINMAARYGDSIRPLLVALDERNAFQVG
jgi:tetratricopeptide (TPR) repeat protein